MGAETQPVAPPRKAHFQDSPKASRQPAASKSLDNRNTSTPLTPTIPHFIESQKLLDNRTTTTTKEKPSLDNRTPSDNNQTPVFFKPLDNRPSVRRHASFNEKSGLDNRPAVKASVWENNLNMRPRPTDVLRTPYLLSSSNRALHHQSSHCVGN